MYQNFFVSKLIFAPTVARILFHAQMSISGLSKKLRRAPGLDLLLSVSKATATMRACLGAFYPVGSFTLSTELCRASNPLTPTGQNGCRSVSTLLSNCEEISSESTESASSVVSDT